jgi:hypothetical protein
VLRYKKTTHAKLTIQHVMCLLAGIGQHWLDEAPPEDEATLRAFWAQHGDALVTLHIQSIGMGRPWAYWRYTLGIDPPVDADGDDNRYSQAKYLDTHGLRRTDDPPVPQRYPGDIPHLSYQTALSYYNTDYWPEVRADIADVLRKAGHPGVARQVSRTLKVRGGIISQANRYLGSCCSSQRIFPPQIIQVLLVLSQHRSPKLVDAVMTYQAMEQREREAGIVTFPWVASQEAQDWLEALSS